MSEQQGFLLAPDELSGPPAGAAEEAGAPAADGLVPMTDGPLKRMVDRNFLEYASYVIRDRAIPDIDDGLKPVQRRILYSLHRNDDGKFIKVANIVGYCMQFHPHGDASIADALVTLANKQYLIERQGNFGNVFTGDPAAASRYIECRLTDLARDELFNDELTEFVPTYDGRKEEPVALPARLPMLLLLGAEGIAVGLATRILPHNFNELLEAQVHILHDEPFEVFPDFPQGGLMDVSAYDRGRGCVRVRARIEVRDPQTLVIREVPFGTTTDSLIASIEDAARKGKLKLKTINDFTAGSVEIEIQLQPEQDAARAMDALYAFTQCEFQIPSRIMVIRDRRPAEMDVEEVLRHNTTRLLDLLKKELKLRQKRLTEDLHRRTLVQVFVEQRLYKPIEACRSQEEVDQVVRQGLVPYRDQFQRDLTHGDIEMLLGIPIRRISQFDLDKNHGEMQQIRDDLVEAGRNLANLVPYAVRYLRNLQRKHAPAFPRRTEITPFEAVALRELTASELTVAHDREKGYLGHKIAGAALFECSSLDKLLLVWKDGRYKIVSPPEKLFVDTGLIYCAVLDRERVLTVVYGDSFFTYIKKFTPGGSVTNREYRCIARGSDIRLLAADDPPLLYVRYAGSESQSIKQQEFPTEPLPVKDRDARGAMLTSKKTSYIGKAKPADWDDSQTGPRGTYMNVG